MLLTPLFSDRVYVLTYDQLNRLTREDWWQIESFPEVSIAETVAASQTNEVQRVGFNDGTSFLSGTFTLTFSGQTTSAIAWDADAATVDAALEALSNIGSGDVTVTKITDYPNDQLWEVTFTGSLAATDVAQITINASAVYNGVGAPTEQESTSTEGATINEEQAVTVSNATTGYYRLLLDGYYTDPIAHNASAGAVETALEALTNIDNVTVTGSPGGPYTINFGGTQAGTNISTLTWRPADVEPLANSEFVGSLLYEYDAANQLVEAGYQDGSLDNVATNFFTHDNLGRVTQETATYGGYLDTIVLEQAFDANSNRTQSIHTFGTAEQFTRTSVYDNLNRLTQLTFEETYNDAYWNRAEFAYNALGQFTSIERFVGDATTPISVVETAFTYDDLHRLFSITHTADSATVAGYDYAYDLASRIVSIDSYLDGLSEFDYDDTNQLVGADHTGSSDETYTYDATGNRTMSGYSTGDNNQLLSDGTHDYTYDAEGNRLTRTVIATGYVTAYVWDHRNRLIGVNEFDDSDNLLSTVVNTYDVFDRWIKRSVDSDGPGGTDAIDSYFAWDGQQMAAEINGDEGEDLAHLFHWGPAVDQLMADIAVAEAEPINFALTDHLGTPRDFVEYDFTNTETDHIGHRIYNAFGKLTSQTGTGSAIGFTGIYFEISIGFGHHRKRWYDPNVGRWISEDPIGFAGGDFNIARYVKNSSLSFVDPSGLFNRGPSEDIHWSMQPFYIGGAFLYGYNVQGPINILTGVGNNVIELSAQVGDVFVGGSEAGLNLVGANVKFPTLSQTGQALESGELTTGEFYGGAAANFVTFGNYSQVQTLNHWYQGDISWDEASQQIGGTAVFQLLFLGYIRTHHPNSFMNRPISQLLRKPCEPVLTSPATAAPATEASGQRPQLPVRAPLDPHPYTPSPEATPLVPGIEPGTYVYIQEGNGIIQIAPNRPHMHPQVIGNAQPVAAAGEIVIGPGNVISEINNISGTFQFGPETLTAVEAAAIEQGFTVEPGAIKPFKW